MLHPSLHNVPLTNIHNLNWNLLSTIQITSVFLKLQNLLHFCDHIDISIFIKINIKFQVNGIIMAMN